MTAKKKDEFLAVLASTGNISQACRDCAIGRNTAYQHREDDPTFANAWDVALEQYVHKLEAEADRRACAGVIRKKFTRSGKPLIDPETEEQYEEREYSDTLLIFRLKALAPEKYRERQETRLTGHIDLSVLSDEEVEKLARGEA